MAKSGAAAVAAAVEDAELRRELRRLVRAIAEDNEVPVATYEEAARVLSALRELRFGAINGDSNGKERRKEEGEREVESLEIPKRFLCPISSELMRDPVVVASGQVLKRKKRTLHRIPLLHYLYLSRCEKESFWMAMD